MNSENIGAHSGEDQRDCGIGSERENAPGPEHRHGCGRDDGCDHEHDCGHDHGSGHEHYHGQGHDHGSGHEHYHRSGRDHNHGHGHGRRESFASMGGEAFLEAHTHDQAATVSIAICPDEGRSISFTEIESALEDIARRIDAMGGIIGHIKAFARNDDYFAHASITDPHHTITSEGDATQAFDSEADIQLVAIALLIGLDDLIDCCKQSL